MTDHAYINDDYVKGIGSMPDEDVDDLRSSQGGFLDGVYLAVSRLFDAKLSKRYATPFGLDASGAFAIARVPEVVKMNVADVALARMWARRGFNPASKQDEDAVLAARDRALAWLDEAANSKDGLIELPKRDTVPEDTLVSKGGPLSYSESSPYVAFDRQEEDGRREDVNGRGTNR